MTGYLAAAVQLSSTEDKSANLRSVTRLVEQAAAQDARLIALPEMFNCLGRFDAIVAQAEAIPGPTSQTMSDLARRLGIFLLAGSIAESAPSGKAYNTSLLFGPGGELLASYRKMHLADVDLPGQVTLKESRWILPGEDVVATPTACGTIGHATCFDLRFPELFRALLDAGTQVALVPSAFTLQTGRDHWDILLRARAIENQMFVIAPNQCGTHTPELATYGHSAIIDPWGTVLASLGDEEGIALAEIDLARVSEIRTRLPALQHRRL